VTSGGQYFTNANFELKTPCQPPSELTVTLHTNGNVPIAPDLTFDFEDQSGGELSGSYIKGRLDTAGSAQGVVHVAAAFDYEGTHYTCLFDTEWTAKLGA
jgi:hypothetical protein